MSKLKFNWNTYLVVKWNLVRIKGAKRWNKKEHYKVPEWGFFNVYMKV